MQCYDYLRKIQDRNTRKRLNAPFLLVRAIFFPTQSLTAKTKLEVIQITN